jgi:hypothetical protein
VAKVDQPERDKALQRYFRRRAKESEALAAAPTFRFRRQQFLMLARHYEMLAACERTEPRHTARSEVVAAE